MSDHKEAFGRLYKSTHTNSKLCLHMTANEQNSSSLIDLGQTRTKAYPPHHLSLLTLLMFSLTSLSVFWPSAIYGLHKGENGQSHGKSQARLSVESNHAQYLCSSFFSKNSPRKTGWGQHRALDKGHRRTLDRQIDRLGHLSN